MHLALAHSGIAVKGGNLSLPCLLAGLVVLNTYLSDPRPVSANPSDQTPTASKEKQPDSGSAKSDLAQPVLIKVEGLTFQLAPPRGYKRVQREGPYTHIVAWQGEVRPDGSCPNFAVSLITPPADKSEMPDAETICQATIKGIKPHQTDWHQFPTERFKLNGRQYVRVYWTGKELKAGFPMRGYLYATIIGTQYVLFSSEDLLPYDKTTLPLGERCIESFVVK